MNRERIEKFEGTFSTCFQRGVYIHVSIHEATNPKPTPPFSTVFIQNHLFHPPFLVNEKQARLVTFCRREAARDVIARTGRSSVKAWRVSRSSTLEFPSAAVSCVWISRGYTLRLPRDTLCPVHKARWLPENSSCVLRHPSFPVFRPAPLLLPPPSTLHAGETPPPFIRPANYGVVRVVQTRPNLPLPSPWSIKWRTKRNQRCASISSHCHFEILAGESCDLSFHLPRIDKSNHWILTRIIELEEMFGYFKFIR